MREYYSFLILLPYLLGSEKVRKSHSSNRMMPSNTTISNSSGYFSDSGPIQYDENTSDAINSRRIVNGKQEITNRSRQQQQQVNTTNATNYVDLLRYSDQANRHNQISTKSSQGDHKVITQQNTNIDRSGPSKKLPTPEKSSSTMPSQSNKLMEIHMELNNTDSKQDIAKPLGNESTISKRPQKLIRDGSHARKKINKKHAQMNKFLRNLNLIRSKLRRSASDSTLDSPIILQITKIQDNTSTNDSFTSHMHKSASDSALYSRFNRQKNHGYTINNKSILSSGIPVKTILSPYIVAPIKKDSPKVSQSRIDWFLEPKHHKGK